MTGHLHLRDGGTSLLMLLDDHRLPRVVHWGEDLGPLDDARVRELVRALAPLDLSLPWWRDGLELSGGCRPGGRAGADAAPRDHRAGRADRGAAAGDAAAGSETGLIRDIFANLRDERL